LKEKQLQSLAVLRERIENRAGEYSVSADFLQAAQALEIVIECENRLVEVLPGAHEATK
jgi:hypothetical protein